MVEKIEDQKSDFEKTINRASHHAFPLHRAHVNIVQLNPCDSDFTRSYFTVLGYK